jgi:hypothetical protein
MVALRWRDLAASLVLSVGLIMLDYFSGWREMPEFRLWSSIDSPILPSQPHATIFAVVHLVLGLILVIPTTYNVFEVIRVNRQAQAGKNNPIFLLTDGFYRDVRHPMIGMFMLITLGVFFSFCSSLALLVALLLIGFFHLTILYEERSWLIPRFGSEYEDYMKQTPGRYFTRRETALVVLVLVIGALGILF